MTINAAVARYQATKCEEAFREIYNHIYEGDRYIVKRFARSFSIDELDVESMINDKILVIASSFDSSIGKFKNAVYRAIKNGCIDLVRKRVREDTRTTDVMYEDDEGTQNELYEIIRVAPTTGEDEIIEEIQKRRDQRQLITSLLSNANEQTLTSALAFIKTDSYRQAAKLVNTSDKTVKSRIRKLAKRFEDNQFGSYHDYFTVPTEYVG